MPGRPERGEGPAMAEAGFSRFQGCDDLPRLQGKHGNLRGWSHPSPDSLSLGEAGNRCEGIAGQPLRGPIV